MPAFTSELANNLLRVITGLVAHRRVSMEYGEALENLVLDAARNAIDRAPITIRGPIEYDVVNARIESAPLNIRPDDILEMVNPNVYVRERPDDVLNYGAAHTRALALLDDWLSAKQRESFQNNQNFTVIGSVTKALYTIGCGHAGNVQVSGVALCFGLPHLPLGDHLLAQKIMLENDERECLRVANIAYFLNHHVFAASEVALLMADAKGIPTASLREPIFSLVA